MDWFIRFCLGLPAREEDASAVRQAIPELQREGLNIQRRHYLWLFEDFPTNEAIIDALRGWVSNVDEGNVPIHGPRHRCPLSNCPWKDQHSGEGERDDLVIAEYLVAAGGPDAKPPRDSFFELVRRTHPIADPPRDVILTDPYIYSDMSEDGFTGGFDNLTMYLKTLGLSTDDSFSLSLTPSPKRGTVTAKRNLHRHLKKIFQHVQLKDFSPRLKFHDRFYIVRHRSGELKGVFGPSLNGLSSDSIVMMGDIGDIQPLKKLQTWFG